MIDFFINPLSASGQFYSAERIEQSLLALVRCIDYLTPAVGAQNVRLCYDDGIELRGLGAWSGGFISDLNLVRNRDLVRRWFLHVKNRARRLVSEQYFVVVSTRALGPSVKVEGSVRGELTVSGAKWLSFDGTSLNEQLELDVTKVDDGVRGTVTNTCAVASLARMLPRYEQSPKHRREEYTAAGGELVSAMTLDDDTAQEVLLRAKRDGDDWFGFESGRYYRFKRTHVDAEI